MLHLLEQGEYENQSFEEGKMVELNSKVVKALEQGKLREILLGEDEYFLPDTTFRGSHNLLLVMFVLMHWVRDTDSKSCVAVAFENLLHELARIKPWDCVDILLAYTITARDNNLSLPICFSSVINLLRANLCSTDSSNRNDKKVLKDLERRFRKIDVDVSY